jgi:hypothetical protein
MMSDVELHVLQLTETITSTIFNFEILFLFNSISDQQFVIILLDAKDGEIYEK